MSRAEIHRGASVLLLTALLFSGLAIAEEPEVPDWAEGWKQTWLDSTGTYLDFAGGFEDGVMELTRTGEGDDAGSVFRMRWENIERDPARSRARPSGWATP